jgi:hypothetical protein
MGVGGATYRKSRGTQKPGAFAGPCHQDYLVSSALSRSAQKIAGAPTVTHKLQQRFYVMYMADMPTSNTKAITVRTMAI